MFVFLVRLFINVEMIIFVFDFDFFMVFKLFLNFRFFILFKMINVLNIFKIGVRNILLFSIL